MSIPARSDRTGTFFVTSATFNRRRLFQVVANAELFLETVQQYSREGNYKFPQPLKPSSMACFYGTAEPVPFRPKLAPALATYEDSFRGPKSPREPLFLEGHGFSRAVKQAIDEGF
jgi:hypothetical protein